MTILEMMDKRKKAWEAAKNFAESHRTENGTMTDEDYSFSDKALYRQYVRMKLRAGGLL